jgi:glycosyltransferase involved in cell wall biosynthesis
VTVARTFAIITTCKGRLEHLKASLPRMLAQNCNEVIVVDYSCPQGTAAYVSENFPSVRVVPVEGQTHFSNWRARNAGASIAQSDVLVFVDADTLLADGAIDWIAAHVPPRTFGYVDSATSRAFNRDGPRLAANQLKGFQVIPLAAFRRVGGYDEILEGYAAGADTDLEQRLAMIGLTRRPIDARIVESVIQHDAASRVEHHASPVKFSYAAGLLYRAAKRTLLRLNRRAELPIAVRRNLYQAATQAASGLDPVRGRVTMNVRLGKEPILMPRQLGFERGQQTLSLQLELSLEEALSEPVA